MSLEIGEKVYFTLNGYDPEGKGVVWYEGVFLRIAYLGPTREPANRVKITAGSHPQTGHMIGEEIFLGIKCGPFDNPIKLIKKRREDLDFCIDPDTKLWTDNFGNEPFMLEQFDKIACKLEKGG